MRWAPMATEFDSDPRIIEVGWEAAAVFLCLIRICGRVGTREGGIPVACSSSTYVSRLLGADRKFIDRSLVALGKVDLIRTREDGSILVVAWEKWCPHRDETNADRQRKHRDKRRYSPPRNGDSNADVTRYEPLREPLRNAGRNGDVTDESNGRNGSLGSAPARPRDRLPSTNPPNPPQAGGLARGSVEPFPAALVATALRILDAWARRRRVRDPMAYETREDVWPTAREPLARYVLPLLERYPESEIDSVLAWADTDGPHEDGFPGWREALAEGRKIEKNFEGARKRMRLARENGNGSGAHADEDDDTPKYAPLPPPTAMELEVDRRREAKRAERDERLARERAAARAAREAAGGNGGDRG